MQIIDLAAIGIGLAFTLGGIIVPMPRDRSEYNRADRRLVGCQHRRRVAAGTT
jgi:hypothetical protein